MSVSEQGERLTEWLSALPQLNHYEVLGLEQSQDTDIRDAFHAFSERFHPDRIGSADPEVLSAARRIYQRGAEAYRVLRDPRQRAAYDLTLAASTPEAGSRESDSPLRTMEALCTTKAGRLHAKQAERALVEDHIEEAKALLEKALWAEGENPALKERLEAVRTLLFLRG